MTYKVKKPIKRKKKKPQSKTDNSTKQERLK